MSDESAKDVSPLRLKRPVSSLSDPSPSEGAAGSGPSPDASEAKIRLKPKLALEKPVEAHLPVVGDPLSPGAPAPVVSGTSAGEGTGIPVIGETGSTAQPRRKPTISLPVETPAEPKESPPPPPVVPVEPPPIKLRVGLKSAVTPPAPAPSPEVNPVDPLPPVAGPGESPLLPLPVVGPGGVTTPPVVPLPIPSAVAGTTMSIGGGASSASVEAPPFPLPPLAPMTAPAMAARPAASVTRFPVGGVSPEEVQKQIKEAQGKGRGLVWAAVVALVLLIGAGGMVFYFKLFGGAEPRVEARPGGVAGGASASTAPVVAPASTGSAEAAGVVGGAGAGSAATPMVVGSSAIEVRPDSVSDADAAAADGGADLGAKPVATAPALPPPPPSPSAAFIRYAEGLTISGVRQGNPARALVNGRLVGSGDTLDAGLGVVFVGVDPGAKQLILRERSGAEYRVKY